MSRTTSGSIRPGCCAVGRFAASLRAFLLAALGGAMLVASSAGLMCGGVGTFPPPGNTPPTALIIEPTQDVFLENGESTLVRFSAQSFEENATLEILLDRDSTFDNGNELTILSGFNVPSGVSSTSGQVTFDSTNQDNATYRVFARVSDGENAPVVVAAAGSIIVAPPGSRPSTAIPQIVVLEPTPNLGLSTGDTVTVRYVYSDSDSQVTVTLLLDKDRDPTNDDINNPGDPNDPNSKIIILPNAARKATDPTFGTDPPPPDDPNNLPTDPDSVQIRRNPRTLPQTIEGLPSEEKVYLFDIDLSQIPPRPNGERYFIRATISDGVNPPTHSYAIGSLTVLAPARGTVDMASVGFTVSGARFQGFSAGEFLGTEFEPLGDIDLDGVDDFMLVSRFGSPRNRFQTGAGYLFFGRRKQPFPPDSNGNGLPDVLDPNGEVVDFPETPLFIHDPNVIGSVSPYDSRVVGRFGGTISVNSIGTLVAGAFYRGVTYLMPAPHRVLGTTRPPVPLRDPDHPTVNTSGLMSVTRVNLTGLDLNADNVPLRIPDFIFGVPFVSHPREFLDDDPCDDGVFYGDGLPNPISSQEPGNDDMAFNQDFPIDTGLVMMVSGQNDLVNIFRQVVDAAAAGQFDPNGFVDDEGLVSSGAQIPDGVRLRGRWHLDFEPTNEFGRTVAAVPSLDNDVDVDLLISAPGFEGERGAVMIFLGQDFRAEGFHEDDVLSIPSYGEVQAGGICLRGLVTEPAFATITGAASGDRFGQAGPAGDLNQDGTVDILAGAPGADTNDTNGLTDNGITYVFFTPRGGYGEADLSDEDLPRIEIHGIHSGDRFGEVHAVVGDINGDGVADIAVASPNYDDDNRGNVDAGFVGVIYGDRPITGEAGFFPEQIGTPALPGVRFFGTTIGARAGASVAAAGDFNRDGFDDLLIASPGETRVGSDGQDRRGVAYLIFGGTHLDTNGPVFNLSQVGSPQLPGLVFISPYADGSIDQAAIEVVAGIGDVDDDGFADVVLGLPRADFVFPASPNQRRRDSGEVYLIYGNGP